MKMLIAAILACITGGALGADHTLSLHGGGSHERDCWEDIEHCGTGSFDPYVEFMWIGTVSAVVATDGDGTFSGADFVSLQLNSNVVSFSALSSEVLGSITVLGGEVTSIDVYYRLPGTDISVDFHQLSVTYTQPPQHHYGPTWAGGTLTPVPEPEIYVLLSAGLLLVVRRTARDSRA
jgi:hypothetical protein